MFNSLVLFADIIDSSKYSSIFGSEQYAKNLVEFRRIFQKLSEEYFKYTNFNISNIHDFYFKQEVRGDEGFLVCVAPTIEDPGVLIFHAIEFSFMLKASMELMMRSINDRDIAPNRMKVGIGINFGPVVAISDTETIVDKIPAINRIEGYTVNYTKRVESSSRIGKYSKVFISKSANPYLFNYPVVLQKYQTNLTGIENNEDVFEVVSVFMRSLKPNLLEDKLKEEYVIGKDIKDLETDFINEPWLKSFLLSILACMTKDPAKTDEEKKKLNEKISSLSYYKWNENDPILLFNRALLCCMKEKYTMALNIIKEIIKMYPSFIYLHKEFVKVLSEMLSKEGGSSCLPIGVSDMIYARDIAEDIIYNFKKVLKDESEIEKFSDFIIKVNEKLCKG
jgi:class 3 adenylate cyclase